MGYNCWIMLKSLTILTVFLAIGQTLSPVPRQTSNGPAHRSAQTDQSAQKQQSPTALSVPRPDAAKGDPPEPAAKSIHREDGDQSVTISKLVPVSVERDWLDYATWVAGLVLLGVGIAGVWLANRTLKAVEKQADLTKEQSDLMVEKERAKLRIQLNSFELVQDEYGTYNVSGSVLIYGSTEAFVAHTEVYASVGPVGLFNPLPEWFWGLHLEPVIRPNAAPIPFSVMVMAEDGPADKKQILSVRKGEESVYCMAKIEFADVFGRKWVFRLRRRFRAMWAQVESPDSGEDEGVGSWEDSGPANDNGEYRNETETPKPN